VTELLIILMSWAAHLSGYPMPAELPEIQFRPHKFFVEHVCGGKECNVLGWYNDNGVVYIDDSRKDLSDGFTSSLLVHEFVHFLQPANMNGCARQTEAYAVQNMYIEIVLTTAYRAQFKCNSRLAFTIIFDLGSHDGNLRDRRDGQISKTSCLR